LSPKDTAAVDQFQVGGFEATEKLAQLLCPSQGPYVLDVGSGVSCRDLSSSELRFGRMSSNQGREQEKFSPKELRRLTKNLRKVNRNEQRPASTSRSVLNQRLRWSNTLAQR
jgi:hypothetical protein